MKKDKKYSKYSLGMKQKLAIAQVLMEDPEIMIFDEPFNGIEEKTVKIIKNILPIGYLIWTMNKVKYYMILLANKPNKKRKFFLWNFLFCYLVIALYLLEHIA